MNVFEDSEIRSRLYSAFPKSFVNAHFEFIVHPGRNSYFLLDGVETEPELDAKVIEWLSREAIKGGSRQTQKYHLDGINRFLGTNFTPEQMEKIYTYLGNCCNHSMTMRFIESGYNLTVLTEEVAG